MINYQMINIQGNRIEFFKITLKSKNNLYKKLEFSERSIK